MDGASEFSFAKKMHCLLLGLFVCFWLSAGGSGVDGATARSRWWTFGSGAEMVCKPVWAQRDIPGATGEGRVVVHLNAPQVSSENTESPKMAGVMIYAHVDTRFVGVVDTKTGERILLCDQALLDQNQCAQPDQLIFQEISDIAVPGGNPYAHIQPSVVNLATADRSSLSMDYVVHRSCLMCVQVLWINVTEAYAREAQENLKITFTQPYGSLPADQYFYLAFYGYVSLLYAVIGVVWAFVWFKTRGQERSALQKYISVLLLVVVTHYALLFGYYESWNNVGWQAAGFLILAETVGAFVFSLSFYILFLIAHGHEIFKSVSREKQAPAKLLSALVGCSFVLYGLIGELTTSGPLHLASGIPLIITTTLLYRLILRGCHETLVQFWHQQNEYMSKYYKYFRWLLWFAAVVMVAFVVVDTVILQWSRDYTYLDTYWTSIWIYKGGWVDVLYCLCFLITTYLWRAFTREDRKEAQRLRDDFHTDFEMPQVQLEDRNQWNLDA